jgi:hypothetical protein
MAKRTIMPEPTTNGDDLKSAPPADRISEAQQAIENDRQARGQAFKAELDQLCAKYRCNLVPQIVIAGNQIQSAVSINILP